MHIKLTLLNNRASITSKKEKQILGKASEQCRKCACNYMHRYNLSEI